MPELRAQLEDNLGPVIQRAMPRIQERGAEILEAAGLRMAGLVQRHLKDRGIYDTGETRKSITSRVAAFGGTGQLQAIVSSSLRYAEAIHEGREKGKTPPPMDVLEEWVLRRARQGRIQLDAEKGRKYSRGAKKGRLKTMTDQRARQARSIAFLIQRKIRQKGIEPRPFFDEVFDRHGKAEGERVSRQLAAVIRKELDNG